MKQWRIEVDTWDGLTLAGTVAGATRWQAARIAQKTLGGQLVAMRTFTGEVEEVTAYQLRRLNKPEKQSSHGKWDVFATIGNAL